MIKLKELLLEAKAERAMEDLLRKAIKGSKFQGKVYIAGGYPRDELLGLDPKDIDLVVELPDGGIKFAEWITRKFGVYKQGSNPITYPKFGTAKFQLYNVVHNGIDLSNIEIEAVMTRVEKYTKGSRKPTVKQGSLKDDVERRDFTVNSLLKDLSTGEILDLTGMGKNDIKSGKIVTTLDPDLIFREDPLRMLRAIRFTVKYGWKLPLFMIRAIKNNSNTIKNISPERVRDELDKMLVTGKPATAIRLLQITGLSAYVLPEFDLLVGLKQNKYHKWDVGKHSLEVLNGVPANLKTRLAALFHDIGKLQTRTIIDGEIHFYRHEEIGSNVVIDIMRRLKYPNNIIKQVSTAVRNHMRLKQSGDFGEIISDKALRKLKAELGDHLEHTLDLMDSDNKAHIAGHALPQQIQGIRNRLKNLDKDLPKKVTLPINGNDVMKVLGIKSGPLVKVMLDVVKDAYFENPRITKSKAIALIKKEYKNLK